MPTMEVNVLFIGERRSELAKRRNVRWEDKALASKQLHDALKHNGFVGQAKFINIVTPGARQIIESHTGPRIGMGRKVQDWLTKREISHIPMIHPAARGRIRLKENYAKHVGDTLKKALKFSPVPHILQSHNT